MPSTIPFMAGSTKARGPSAARESPEQVARETWKLLMGMMLANRTRLFRAMADFDLSPMQGHTLRLLEPGQPVAMSTLAESLVCDASNVTGIVDRLEARGLLERHGADHDRRVKSLVVTAEGERVRERLMERIMEPPDFLTRLSDRDQRTLGDILRRALPADVEGSR